MKINWTPPMLAELRKVGKDRMSTEAWETVESLLNHIERLHKQQWEIAEAIFTNDPERAMHWAAGIKVSIRGLGNPPELSIGSNSTGSRA